MLKEAVEDFSLAFIHWMLQLQTVYLPLLICSLVRCAKALGGRCLLQFTFLQVPDLWVQLMVSKWFKTSPLTVFSLKFTKNCPRTDRFAESPEPSCVSWSGHSSTSLEQAPRILLKPVYFTRPQQGYLCQPAPKIPKQVPSSSKVSQGISQVSQQLMGRILGILRYSRYLSA